MQIFDIDGVVADLQFYFIKDLCEYAGCTYDEIDITTHNITLPGYTLTEEEIFDVAVNATVKHVHEIQPHKNAIEYLVKYHKHTKQPINFLTARTGEVIENATHVWLKKHLPADYTVHFNPNKVQFMKDNKQFNVIFEDRFATVNQLSFVPYVFLITRPWNIGRIAAPHVLRIDDMHQAPKFMGRC